MELEITNGALDKIKSTAKEYGIEPIVRIFVESAACRGANFGIAFDEPKQYDILTEIEGVEFVTDTSFLPKYTSGLKIDYSFEPREGYIIKSMISPEFENKTNKENKCSSGCSGCSCSSKEK